MIYSIYKLNSPENKSYIGQTRQLPETRFKQHKQFWLQKPKTTYQRKLHEGFNQFGFDCFTKEVLSTCETQDQANELERQFIQQFNSVDNGYNTTCGGQGLHRLTLNKKHKQGISQGKQNWWNTPEGEEYKKVLSKRYSEYNPGAEASRGKPSWNSGKKYEEVFGKERTKQMNESRAKKCREAMLGRKITWADKISAGKKGKWTEKQQKAAEKSGAKRRGIPSHPNQKKTARELMQKTYLVTGPNGEQLTVTNLRQWALTRGFEPNNMYNKSSGSKGWKAKRL